jgi:hypothetical protein
LAVKGTNTVATTVLALKWVVWLPETVIFPVKSLFAGKKCEIALAPGLDACPANGAIVAAPVIRARTAHELQGLLSALGRFVAWFN